MKKSLFTHLIVMQSTNEQAGLGNNYKIGSLQIATIIILIHKGNLKIFFQRS